MKKLILLFVSVLISVFGYSQENRGKHQIIKGNGITAEETREVGAYHSILVKNGYDVVLVDEPQGKVRLVGEKNINPIVITEVKNGVLEIFLKPKMGYSTKKWRKRVVYVPAQGIKMISITGTSDIENEGLLSIPELNISVEGSGDVALKNLKSENIIVNIKGTSDVKLLGETKNIKANVKGSGDISAFGLIAENVEVEVNGTGDVEVFATQSFVGDLKGSGSIEVKGNPKKVKQNSQGIGKIRVL